MSQNQGLHATWSWLGCHGDMHTVLERMQQGEWTRVYERYDHGCPAAVTLAPGEPYESGLDLTNSPEEWVPFEPDTIAGVYRVVLQAWAVRPYDTEKAEALGDSVPTLQRVSDPFYLLGPEEGVWHRRLLRFMRGGPR